jgi:hypothetical protein
MPTAPTPSVYSAAASPYTNNPFITSGLFSTEFQAPTIGGKSAYDIQRQQINAEAEKTLQRRTEALQRQMATQGLGQSGIGLSAQLQQQQALAGEQGKALSAVDIAQLGAAEEQAAAARERQVKVGMSFAELSMEEQKLAEGARQFADKAAFDQWATSGGWTNDQIDRVWNAYENDKKLSQSAQQFTDKQAFDTWAKTGDWSQQDIDRAWQSFESDKKLAQSAQQFTDKLAFDEWATKGGWSQQDIDRAWQSGENQKTRDAAVRAAETQYIHDYALQVLQGAQATDLATLNSDLTTGRMTAQAIIDARVVEDKAIADSYFNQGLGGTVIPPDQLEALKSTNPLAYYSYLSGQSGMAKNDFDFQQGLLTSYLNAMLLNASEKMGTADFETTINGIFAGIGFNPYNTPGMGQTVGSAPSGVIGSAAVATYTAGVNPKTVTDAVKLQATTSYNKVRGIINNTPAGSPLPAQEKAVAYGMTPETYRAGLEDYATNGTPMYLMTTQTATAQGATGTPVTSAQLQAMAGKVILLSNTGYGGTKAYMVARVKPSVLYPPKYEAVLISPEDNSSVAYILDDSTLINIPQS